MCPAPGFRTKGTNYNQAIQSQYSISSNSIPFQKIFQQTKIVEKFTLSTPSPLTSIRWRKNAWPPKNGCLTQLSSLVVAKFGQLPGPLRTPNKACSTTYGSSRCAPSGTEPLPAIQFLVNALHLDVKW